MTMMIIRLICGLSGISPLAIEMIIILAFEVMDRAEPRQAGRQVSLRSDMMAQPWDALIVKDPMHVSKNFGAVE